MGDPASFIANWLTPSYLFILVNLVIGTIAITCRFASTPEDQPQQLLRSPSLLQRVRSFTCTHHQPDTTAHTQPQPQPQLLPTPSLLERVASFNLSLHKQHPAPAETRHLQPQPQHKHQGEPEPEPQPEPQKPELVRCPSLLQRIQSMNLSRFYRSDSMQREPQEEEEEEVERRRPATATARIETASCREDEEVDAKADDFINSFKKQLRLQRIESLLRYRGTT
ncbi:pathogen-associated molecular patterns-induced protein A70 [Cajanus cajan]|uniref:DUF4408 domain-containing protein n=1 Tax=Cajanus cajan TaxID=3821 RepID=A0A151SS10_CAJCA|nr:pathogen-associated molecular patterns-induced protein A70 [Cajanus cajan]KYP57548.1 hypothetical protein KK1_003813 [Cajanus cajan]